ncbi:MAG: RsmE family RNA methyltransferase [Acidimicrobiales bacterium]
MNRLAGSPGPHVFVESLDSPTLSEDDRHHLVRSLRMRAGDALTLSDGNGRWCPAVLNESDQPEPTGEIAVLESAGQTATIAFSLVKAGKPEFVIQKLTELGIGHIVVLAAERSVARWDDGKIERANERWNRIAREAAMQSHRTRVPTIDGVHEASVWLASNPVAIAHFGGGPIGAGHNAVAVGPEGGWTPGEVEVATSCVGLGDTVLRAETAAISAGTLLCEAKRSMKFDES